MRTDHSSALWLALRFFGAFVGAVIVLRLLTVDVGLSELLAIGITLVVAEVLWAVARKRRLTHRETDDEDHSPMAR